MLILPTAYYPLLSLDNVTHKYLQNKMLTILPIRPTLPRKYPDKILVPHTRLAR